MKKLITSVFLVAIAGFLFSFSNKAIIEDTNSCIKKVGSEWGAVCEDCVNYKGYKRDYSETYTVYLQNTCSDKIEVKCCVQEADKTWRCFPEKVLNPNDTITGFACRGSGKYLYWTRKAGDREIVFPTDQEVNQQYKD